MLTKTKQNYLLNIFESSRRCLCGGHTISSRGFHRRQSSTSVRNVNLDHVIIGENTSNDLSPIFVCHGLFGNKKNWNMLSKKMNEITGRKVVTYDAVNHGNSSHHDEMSYHNLADDLFHLMDQLKARQAVLVGHSMGGKTVMTAALTQPKRVEKLVVVDASPATSNTSGEVYDYMKHMYSMNMNEMKTRKDVKEKLKEVTKSQTMILFLMTNLMTTPEGQLRWRVGLKGMTESYHQHIHKFPEFNAGVCYEGPTQFIGGGRSKYITEYDYEEIYKRFPNASIEHVPDAGHWVHSEKPNEFLNIVNTFLNKN